MQPGPERNRQKTGLRARTKLLPLNLEVIYASPLKRALQTAEIAAGQMKPTPKIEIIPNLREGNFGLAEGSRIGKLMRDCPN